MTITENKDPELTQEELAARWRLSVATLITWRSKKWVAAGRGLPFNKRGRTVTYYLSEIKKYEEKNKITPAGYEKQ